MIFCFENSLGEYLNTKFVFTTKFNLIFMQIQISITLVAILARRYGYRLYMSSDVGLVKVRK